MSRLIDADVLKEELGKSWAFENTLYDVCRIINDAPTIDAVEVVRCKDCKNWVGGDTCWGIPFSGDDASYIGTEANDFCSYGEKETDHE